MAFFDQEAFNGAFWSLSEAIDEAARITGIKKEQLTLALYQHAVARKNKRDAGLWKTANSPRALSKWIYKQAGGRFDITDERKMVKLADEIPALIRRGLIELAEKLPIPRGGKQPSLDPFARFEARYLVRVLRGKNKRISKQKAYAEVAKQLKVSAHTVRRECEPKERERSRYRKDGHEQGDRGHRRDLLNDDESDFS